MIALSTLPHGWEKIDKSEISSTISTFRGGYRSKLDDKEIRVWENGSSTFYIKDGEMYFPDEIDEKEADYVGFGGTSKEIIHMLYLPEYYVGRFYRCNVTMVNTEDPDQLSTIKASIAEDFDEASDIVEQWLEEEGAFDK
jgi:hypothetical protein